MSGDSSNVAWTAKSTDLTTWLKGGTDWKLAGDASHVTLTGTVDSEAIKQTKGAEAQALFGEGVTVDNQLVVKMAETAPAAIAAPPAAKLYFASGETSLPADSAQTLAPVIAWLKANSAAKAVVSGFHDPSGSLSANQEIAKNRAKASAQVLISAGIDAARIEMRKPVSTEGTGDKAEARRVEVSVE